MIRPTLVPWTKFVLFGFLVFLLSTSRVLAQAPIVRNELHHDIATPLREVAVNPPAVPSANPRGRTGDACLTPGFKNMGTGGQGRD
jgi:hypothetical protein